MSVTDRIREIIEYKNISARQFCIDVGIANGYLDKVKDVGSEKLLKILNTYPEINPEWLLTGKGEMLRKETNLYDINFGGNIQTIFEAKENYNKLQKDQEINLYDINAAANLQTLFDPDKKYSKIQKDQEINLYDINAAANLQTLFASGQQNVIGKLRIPNLPKCDGAIYLRGDSMYPLLKSGDIVIYKILNNLSNLTFGEMYLIDYAIDGDDYLVVKYINASELENHIRLVSYNPHFSPMDIPLSSVRSIAIIKASVRINTLV